MDALSVVVVVSGATVTVTASEAEAARFDVPPKVAVIASLPVGNVDRLTVATPLPFTVPVPTDDPLLRKLTTPLVAGTPLPPTVAVRVTVAPNDGLIADAIKVVVVVSGETVTVTAFEAEAARFDVPPKLAVIEFAPIDSVVRFNVATPLFTDPVATGSPPLRKVTTPLVTWLLLALTVAVKVTAPP